MKIVLFIFCGALFGLTGCSTPSTITPLRIVEPVKLAQKAERLTESTTNIQAHNPIPEIIQETEKINVVATELKQDDLEVRKLQEQVLNLQEEIKRVHSDVEKSYQAKLGWGITIGGIMLVAGIVLSVFASQVPMLVGKGIMLVSTGILMIAICFGMQMNSLIVEWLGGILSLSALGYGVYLGIKNFKDNSKAVKANEDLTKIIELIKHKLPTEEEVTQIPKEWAKHVITWEGDLKDIISKLTHPDTQAIVKSIKDTVINNKI